MSSTVQTATEIRTFHVDVPDEELAELRRRIAATRWPSKELVADWSQGVRLTMLQELARYWTEEYDFARIEARLNACPSSRPRSTASTSISSTSSRRMRTPCRS
jgi:hypothetical protein